MSWLFSFVSYDIHSFIFSSGFYRRASQKLQMPDVYFWLKPNSNCESVDNGKQYQVSLRSTIGSNDEIH